jgi:peptide/nickel transport system permease protein
LIRVSDDNDPKERELTKLTSQSDYFGQILGRNPIVTTLRRVFKARAAKTGGIIILAFIVLLLLGPYLTPYNPYASGPAINSPPSYAHPLGTDYLGHDILSQVIYGAYPSMLAGILAAVGAVIVGTLVGVLAGYFRKLEGVLTGSADVILTFPPLPLMVLLGSIYPATTTLITIILIVVLWPVVARSIRSQVLSLKERPFVQSSKTSGMNDFEIIRRVIFPDIMSLAMAYFVLMVAAAIVLTTALEFLGIGNPDVVSWGSMLYWAQQFAFYAGDWWWILAPGLSITLVATGFALLGFSVEEIMNPRLRKVA